jgi:nitrogen fixation NifU-like protein
MVYTYQVLDHHNNLRNRGTLDKGQTNLDTGWVGMPECGDVMKLQNEVEGDRIADTRFKTFGCGSAIADFKSTWNSDLETQA